jgi:dihydroxyacetone kinase-like protein
MTDSLALTEYVVRTIAEGAVENEKFFGELDAVVGDGDFGFSLARGFEYVLAEWDTIDRADAGTFLGRVAVMITGHIGGTSGPIWGTAFLRAGARLKGLDAVTGSDVVEALRASVEGIKKRGHAELGDKTLLDALVPGIDALEKSVGAQDPAADSARSFASAAREAADATSTLEAKRGRAAYSGERSIGSQDAGAVGLAVLAERVAEHWPQN